MGHFMDGVLVGRYDRREEYFEKGNTVGRPSIEPITEPILLEFATFLSAHLNSSFSAQTWETALRNQWTPKPPNYGFVLRDDRRVVGGIGAYYADRLIRGE